MPRFQQTASGIIGLLSRNYRQILHALGVVRRLWGDVPRSCNICNYHGKFLGFGMPPRFDAVCVACGSLERHRLLKALIDCRPQLVRGQSVLHFAPEASILKILRPEAMSYVTADVDPDLADTVLDIEDMMSVKDDSFGLIVCSHVIEHVDDRRALLELSRIVKPGGAVLIMTPVIEGWKRTYENESITAPAARVLHFGQCDHLRYFGADIRDRIRGAGLEVEEFTAEEPLVSKFGLMRGEKVFIASKRSDA